MLNTIVDVDGLEQLEKHIQKVERMAKMQVDSDFQAYIKQKAWDTLQEVMGERLKGGTTNDDAISTYIASNHLEDIDGGFKIYNDAKIPADYYNIIPFNVSDYPDGKFSIALAFEYGVGIVGISTNYGNNPLWKSNAVEWSLSPHRTETYWYLPKNVTGESGVRFQGFEGFEIYRYTADRITKNLNKWINEYFRKEV